MSDAGSVDVPVALSAASSSTVSVMYQTLDKTAKAGVDYDAVSGTLTFPPGQTLTHIHIPLEPDNQAGPNLVFQVKLKKPTGATLGLSTSSITLVDPAGPMLAYVNNPVVQPASSGQTANFVVSLSSPVGANHTVAVPYTTASGSAVAGTDYTTTAGTLVFTAGQSALTVPVPILDASVATARTFSLKLGKATGTALTTNKGTATIAPVGAVVKPALMAVSPTVVMSGANSVVDVPVARWRSHRPRPLPSTIKRSTRPRKRAGTTTRRRAH